ncbi:MAG: hypothetical protein IT208_04505 [Chthonomonadales bacterium]|nr:hypothetical protein [Chthonomonadales bacterium]
MRVSTPVAIVIIVVVVVVAAVFIWKGSTGGNYGEPPPIQSGLPEGATPGGTTPAPPAPAAPN